MGEFLLFLSGGVFGLAFGWILFEKPEWVRNAVDSFQAWYDK
jgi:hypothetical protein